MKTIKRVMLSGMIIMGLSGLSSVINAQAIVNHDINGYFVQCLNSEGNVDTYVTNDTHLVITPKGGGSLNIKFSGLNTEDCQLEGNGKDGQGAETGIAVPVGFRVVVPGGPIYVTNEGHYRFNKNGTAIFNYTIAQGTVPRD